MNRTVLLIEDDPIFRGTVKLNLEEESYEFFEAESPKEGIELLGANPELRVVVLDLQFGQGAGTSVLDFIETKSANYRVIVLTGHDELLLAETAEKYQVFHYLPKADRSTGQSIRFAVDAAFRDLEREQLIQKTRFLLEVQGRINESHPLTRTLDLICRRALEMVGGYTCHIRVYDFRKGDFHLQGFAGRDEGLRKLFLKPRAKGDLFSGEVVVTGKSKWHDDLQALPSFQSFAQGAFQGQSPTPEEAAYWRTVQSAYIVPISTGLFVKQVDAVLNVSSERIAYFDEEKRATVDEFATQATLAITKDWLRRKRDEAHEDYGAISRMLGEMSGESTDKSNLEAVFAVVTRKISELVRPELVSIFVYDEGARHLENVAELRGNEPNPKPCESYRPGQSLTGSVFESEETIHLPLPDDLEGAPLKDKRYNKEDEESDRLLLPSGDIRHYLGVPIMVGGKCRGVLRAVNKKSEYYEPPTASSGHQCLLERGFSIDCRNVLEITASHLAIAIRNAELIREKEAQVGQVHTLGEVGRLINSAHDLKEVLKLTMEEMARVMQAEICMLFLKDGEDRVVLEECFGMPQIEGAFYQLGEGVTGTVAKNGEPQLLVDQSGRNDGKYDEQIGKFLSEKHGGRKDLESLMVVPISAKSTTLGALKVINRVGNNLQFESGDLDFFGTFADYVGVAIESAQTYRNLSLLVSAVAHEINNTSGVIPANVAGVRTLLPDPGAAVEDMLSVIEKAASQATAFANEIAGFSAKGMDGKLPLDLNTIVRTTVETIDTSRYEVGPSFPLMLELSPKELPCAVYERAFSQIVRNIIINALEALEGRTDGRIVVSSTSVEREDPGFAVLRFQDNGPGIKPEHRSRIFEAEFTTKKKGRRQGNGVGLWLVRTQLQQVGGTIKVESKHGHGSCFTIHVPLADSLPGRS